MDRTLAIVVVALVVGLVGGFLFHDALISKAAADSEAKFEYEVVQPLLSESRTKNRQKIEEAIAGKAKFGWRLVEVEDKTLYFERPAAE